MMLPGVDAVARVDELEPLDWLTRIKLDAYCKQFQACYCPLGSVVWDLAELDTGEWVVQVFDPNIGQLFRTLQKRYGLWEVIDHTADEAVLADGHTLTSLLQRPWSTKEAA